MKQSTLKWHLSRDNSHELAKFCTKFGTVSKTELNTAIIEEQPYFQNTYTFDNGGYIIAELLQGTDKQSFSVSDHFLVIDYNLGK